MKNIQWYNLDREGYIVDRNVIIRPLTQKAAVYIYKLCTDDKEKFYVGSTINMAQRFRQHKYRADIFAREFKYNSIFYNHVTKYGWNNFKFGIIEYMNFESDIEWQDKKDILLKIEQKYLDLLSPELNINKVAGSMLGFKHSEDNILKFGLIHRGKSYVKSKHVLSIRPSISQETILKLKLHNKDITVSIYNKNDELVKEFNRIKIAAEFVGLSASSVSGYIKNGKLWNNLYYFKLKTNSKLEKLTKDFPLDTNNITSIRSISDINKNCKSYKLEVLYNNETLCKFRSIREASRYLNISKITLVKYSTENKLWKNKYKFKIMV
jgi:group I intron endonuclease